MVTAFRPLDNGHKCVLCQIFFEFYEKELKYIFLCNIVKWNTFNIKKFNVLHQMGDFLMCLTSYVTIHKQLVNGFAIIKICSDESIYQSPKFKNVISNFK
jgi:hypothetical protein